MRKICGEERRLLLSNTFNSVCLTRRKLGGAEAEFLLDIETSLAKVTCIRENERMFDKKRVLSLFFKLLNKKEIRKLIIYGVIEDIEILKGFAKKKSYNVKKLVYDNSTDDSVITKFKKKCNNNLKSVQRLDNDKSKLKTNWCHLPMEMRRKCIEHMSFVTKMRLRRTSTTEKALVEHQKHEIDYLSLTRDTWSHIESDFADFDVSVRSDLEALDSSVLTRLRWFNMKNICERTYLHRMKLSMVCSIFKFGRIRNFHTSRGLNYDKQVAIAAKIAEGGPFGIKQISVNDFWDYTVRYWLKNLDTGLETLEINTLRETTLKELIQEPKSFAILMNLKQLQVGKSVQNDSIALIEVFQEKKLTMVEFNQAWIQYDKNVGSRFLETTESADSSRILKRFAEKFAEKIIEESDTVIRILTDNQQSHILLKIYPEKYVNRNVMVYEVIPESTQSSEYKKEHNWIAIEEELSYSFSDYGSFY